MNCKITDIQGVLYLIKRHSLMMALLCGLSFVASCGKKASLSSSFTTAKLVKKMKLTNNFKEKKYLKI